jgi:hypothetical protein
MGNIYYLMPLLERFADPWYRGNIYLCNYFESSSFSEILFPWYFSRFSCVYHINKCGASIFLIFVLLNYSHLQNNVWEWSIEIPNWIPTYPCPLSIHFPYNSQNNLVKMWILTHHLLFQILQWLSIALRTKAWPLSPNPRKGWSFPPSLVSSSPVLKFCSLWPFFFTSLHGSDSLPPLLLQLDIVLLASVLG